MKKLEIYWEQPERPRLQLQRKLWEDLEAHCQKMNLEPSRLVSTLLRRYLGEAAKGRETKENPDSRQDSPVES